MYCTKCGSECLDGAAFCTECGAPVGQDAASERGRVAGQVTRARTSPAVIGIVIGLLAVVVIAVALFSSGIIGADSDAVSSSGTTPATSSSSQSVASASSSSSASSEAAHDSSTADSTERPVVFETESVRITMPSSFAAKGYEWSSASTEDATLTDANGSVLAYICWGEAASRGGETKSESYEIGVVSHGSIGFPAYLRLNYLDSEGKSIYWGKDEEGTLATDYLGVELEDFVSWIELCYVSEFRPAVLKETGTAKAGDLSGDESPAKEPFYGVWVSASKDYDEAQAMADELGGAGFAGSVFVTTDWDNLNSERWYVVTAGCAKTESEAQSLCERVRNAGYSDAYVKYSGDYIGQ